MSWIWIQLFVQVVILSQTGKHKLLSYSCVKLVIHGSKKSYTAAVVLKNHLEALMGSTDWTSQHTSSNPTYRFSYDQYSIKYLLNSQFSASFPHEINDFISFRYKTNITFCSSMRAVYSNKTLSLWVAYKEKS